MRLRQGLPQMTLLVACCLILVALPFVTTYDDLLTAGAMRLGVAEPLQSVSPIEARMVVALLTLFGIHAAAAGSQLVVWDAGGHATNLFISWNCIGWQSLVLLGASLAVGLRGLSTETRTQVLVIGLLGTVLINVIRVALVCMLAAAFGKTPALIFHDYGGTLLTVGWLFAFWIMVQRWVLAAEE
ncbi:MAG TPA: exosortase/archaeosortase family protein [Candidatus Dormibacteraeota bacterium]|jgi:exosortase/archaeosortase family protein|nr:exosortase/archaeosortase family protein [Candidatus Dormibacteraeota bacterium]